jgi:hypothetical protein
MFNILTTLFNAAEHATVQKLGGYKKTAKINANLNLLHKIQDSNVVPTEFYDLDEVNNNCLTLDQILKDNNNNNEEINLAALNAEKPA